MIPRPVAVVFCLAALGPARAGEPAFSAERIRDHVKYLAGDRLEGRGIGTLGEQRTLDYLVEQFTKAGLEPAGQRGTFFQTVPLVGVTTEPTASLAATKGDRTVRFALHDDWVGVSKTQQSEDFDAEAVFVGHGITATEFGWDDYRGVDVKGKVLVMFTNEPPSDDPKWFGGKALTYYGRWTYRFEEAARRGAKAVLIIHTNETAGYPFSVVQNLTGAQIEHTRGTPALALAGWLSHRAGDKLLGMAGMNVADALKQADTRGFKAVPLGIKVKCHLPTATRKILTKNVLGLVPGSDPELKSEAVVFTAHWDHLGVGKQGLGADNIYNGAIDNATGTAILLEMARVWAAQKPRPKRAALFFATTAEESGLLGATYYTQHPVIPLGKTALNLNFDGLQALGVPESIIVNGSERTTVWPLVQKIAKTHNLDIEPDRLPHQGFYYRSDHFPFAKSGVPAFAVSFGEKVKGRPAGFVRKAIEEYIAKFYHTPADQYRDDLDFSGFPTLMRFAFDVARDVANAEGLPTWRPGDEFRAAREKSGVK